MEFSCLWSKDAQQKKRKRWTDGVAKFDPTTGVLTIWDQDESTKVSSSRLKPDEANAVLQENGDETRVGSASLQIMAQLHGTAATHQRDPLAELTVDSARKPEAALTSSRVAPGKVGGRVGAAIGGATRSARGLGTGVKRRLGATITTATANSLLQSPSSPPVRDVSSGLAAGEATAARDERTSPLPLSLPSPSSSSLLTDATPASIVDSMTTPAGDTVLQAAATSTIPQTNTPLAAGGAFAGGLYGRGRGGGLERKRNGCKPPAPSKSLGSSPRYDSADDSSNTVAAAEATATPAVVARNQTGGLRTRGGGNVGGLRRFHAPRLASGKRSSTDTPSNGGTAEGDPVPPFTSSAKAPRLSGVGGNVRRGSDVGAHNAGGGGGSSADGTSAATTTAVVDPEDVVLEWTKGTPPQPIRAGATLARRLHPHQREGLKVLWDCLAGRGGYEGRGAILADEMGLGKTATAIALCTCVLRHRKAECRKAVIVCPSSLVKNWANEFRKWCPLGGGAVAVEQAGAAAAQLVADFKIGAAVRYPILVISYELYRNHGKVINSTEGLGLLIADEGHRLKNSSETKTTKVLKACPASMRLVLGTVNMFVAGGDEEAVYRQLISVGENCPERAREYAAAAAASVGEAYYSVL